MTTYKDLPETSRVWVYQSNRAFTDVEVAEIQQLSYAFSQQWVSHSRELKAFGGVLKNRFIVLLVDESQAGASGCSIDSSVRFIKEIEQKYNVNMFDRLLFTYKDGEQIAAARREDFAALYAEGKINDETLVFNNLVNTKKDLQEKWVVPLKESWHKRMV